MTDPKEPDAIFVVKRCTGDYPPDYYLFERMIKRYGEDKHAMFIDTQISDPLEQKLQGIEKGKIKIEIRSKE